MIDSEFDDFLDDAVERSLEEDAAASRKDEIQQRISSYIAHNDVPHLTEKDADQQALLQMEALSKYRIDVSIAWRAKQDEFSPTEFKIYIEHLARRTLAVEVEKETQIITLVGMMIGEYEGIDDAYKQEALDHVYRNKLRFISTLIVLDNVPPTHAWIEFANAMIPGKRVDFTSVEFKENIRRAQETASHSQERDAQVGTLLTQLRSHIGIRDDEASLRVSLSLLKVGLTLPFRPVQEIEAALYDITRSEHIDNETAQVIVAYILKTFSEPIA